MGILPSAFMIVLGTLVGGTLTTMVVRWIALVIETLDGPTPHPRRMAVLVSVFHAGPWMVVAVAAFAYFEHSEQWARLMGVGIVVSIILLSVLLWRERVKRRNQRAREQNAA